MHRPGIEPGSPAWQASILPLDHRCFCSPCQPLCCFDSTMSRTPLNERERPCQKERIQCCEGKGKASIEIIVTSSFLSFRDATFLSLPFLSQSLFSFWCNVMHFAVLLDLEKSDSCVRPRRRVLGSIVVSIPACHAGDRGSIPRRGGYF